MRHASPGELWRILNLLTGPPLARSEARSSPPCSGRAPRGDTARVLGVRRLARARRGRRAPRDAERPASRRRQQRPFARPGRGGDDVAERLLGACVRVRNEGAYLREWLKFHMLVGVTAFYVFDDASTDGTRVLSAPCVAAGVVVLRNVSDVTLRGCAAPRDTGASRRPKTGARRAGRGAGGEHGGARGGGARARARRRARRRRSRIGVSPSHPRQTPSTARAASATGACAPTRSARGGCSTSTSTSSCSPPPPDDADAGARRRPPPPRARRRRRRPRARARGVDARGLARASLRGALLAGGCSAGGTADGPRAPAARLADYRGADDRARRQALDADGDAADERGRRRRARRRTTAADRARARHRPAAGARAARRRGARPGGGDDERGGARGGAALAARARSGRSRRATTTTCLHGPHALPEARGERALRASRSRPTSWPRACGAGGGGGDAAATAASAAAWRRALAVATPGWRARRATAARRRPRRAARAAAASGGGGGDALAPSRVARAPPTPGSSAAGRARIYHRQHRLRVRDAALAGRCAGGARARRVRRRRCGATTRPRSGNVLPLQRTCPRLKSARARPSPPSVRAARPEPTRAGRVRGQVRGRRILEREHEQRLGAACNSRRR